MFTKCLGGSFNLYKEQAFELTRNVNDMQFNGLAWVEGARIL